MAPRLTLLSIISGPSGTYPALPNEDDLVQLKTTIQAQQQAATNRLALLNANASSSAAHDERKGGKKDKKRRDREATDERERAALAANERAGLALEAVERRRVDVPGDVKIKHERVSPAPSNASSASFKPSQGQTTYGGMLKKKKLKRVLDSDDEGTPSRPTPPPTSGLKLKLAPGGHQKSRPQSSQLDPSPTPSGSTISASQPGANIDWSVPPPPQRPLVPIRPGVQKPLKPGPKRQADVDEDFSDKKAPSQLSIQTFWQNIEPYLRDIREDDLAMLNFKADTPESYLIPPRGRHYTEIWDEEDGLPLGTTPRFSVPSMRWPNGIHPPLVHCVPTEIRDANLVEENCGLGTMTERIVAAVISGPDVAEAAKKEAERRPEPESDGNPPARVDVVDLEDRVKKELRAVMLLGEHEEFPNGTREDDEVTSALRQCQRLLMKQSAINDGRKERLTAIARQRLAYSDYTTVLDEVEKQIEQQWAKRMKKHGHGGKKTMSVDGVISGQGRPPVPDSLKAKLALRRRWMQTPGQVLRERPTGEVHGMPTESIYKGLEGHVEEEHGKDGDGMEVDEADADEVDLSTV